MRVGVSRPRAGAIQRGALRDAQDEIPSGCVAPGHTGAGGALPAAEPGVSLRSAGEDDQPFALIERNPQPMFVFERATLRIIAASAAASRAYGYTHDELLSMGLRDLIADDQLAAFDEFYRAQGLVEAPGLLPRNRRRHRRKDGSEIVVETTSDDLVYRGVPCRILVCEDVAELEQAAADLAEARAQVRATEERYRLLFEHNPQPLAVYDLETLQLINVNEAMVSQYGYSREELLAMSGLDLLVPEDVASVRVYLASNPGVTPPGAGPKGWRHRRKDGTILDVETASDNVTVDGRECRLVLFTNVTDRNTAQLLQAEATARFETAFADAPIGMGLVGLDGRWLKVNRVLCELTGFGEEQLLALAFHELAHPDDRDAHLEVVERMLTGAIDRHTREERCLKASGEAIWIHVAMSLVRDDDGTALYFIVQIEDISERKDLQSELQRLAERDPLTGLWNRRRFHDELERQIHRCQRYGERAAILLFDLDGFKAVNDQLGHKAGDDLLKRIADDLRNRLRATDAIGRLGGDEFAVLLTNVTPDQAIEFAHTIELLVSAATLTINAIQISVTASIGVGLLDAATPSGDHAIIEADEAMYRVKAERTTPDRSEPNRTVPRGARASYSGSG